MSTPERLGLERDITRIRTQLELATATQKDLQNEVQGLRTTLDEAQVARATAESEVGGLRARLEAAETTLADRTATIDDLQARLLQQEGELGQLRGTVATIDPLKEELTAVRADRDRIVTQLGELQTTHVEELARVRADLEARIPVEVQAALAVQRQEHDKLAAAWTSERKELQDRIADLEAAQGTRPEARSVAADDLASQFRSVVDDLSKPSAVSGAALTSLEVEARGVYAPPEAGQAMPRIVAPDPGTGDPGALTTVRMRFGLVPQIAPTQPPPER